jgi:hypothetical protein
MIIFSEQNDVIIDTKKFDVIGIDFHPVEDEDEDYPDDNCKICAYGSDNYSYVELGEYSSYQEAAEVLRKIFDALDDEDETFEMPDKE